MNFSHRWTTNHPPFSGEFSMRSNSWNLCLPLRSRTGLLIFPSRTLQPYTRKSLGCVRKAYLMVDGKRIFRASHSLLYEYGEREYQFHQRNSGPFWQRTASPKLPKGMWSVCTLSGLTASSSHVEGNRSRRRERKSEQRPGLDE